MSLKANLQLSERQLNLLKWFRAIDLRIALIQANSLRSSWSEICKAAIGTDDFSITIEDFALIVRIAPSLYTLEWTERKHINRYDKLLIKFKNDVDTSESQSATIDIRISEVAGILEKRKESFR